MRFTGVFIGIVIMWSVVAVVDEVVFDGAAAWGLCCGTASVATAILQLFDEATSVVGNQVHYRSLSFDIIVECTGLDLVVLFVAATAAFPGSWKWKFGGMSLGVPILAVANVLRIVVLVLIGAQWPSSLEYMHLYAAPFLLLVMTLGLWFAWAAQAEDASHR